MGIISKIRNFFKGIEQWQENLRPVTKHSEAENECKNCGLHYKGNFCPDCGQTSKTKRFTLHNALLMTLEVWGMGNRSMPRTVFELIVRPGYMIKDYLNGRRISYFPPVKMLFVFCIFLSFILFVLPIDYVSNFEGTYSGKMVIGPESKLAPKMTYEEFSYDICYLTFNWLDNHKVVELLIYHTCFLFLTMLVFRISKNGYMMTLTEHFFSQMYIASQMMILSIIYICCTLEYNMIDIYPLPLEFMFLIFVYNYKQLFNYSWIRTIFKVILIYILLLMFLVVALVILVIAAHYMAEQGYVNLDVDS